MERDTPSPTGSWLEQLLPTLGQPGNGDWRDVNYGAGRIPETVTNLRTTAKVIIIWENWFDDGSTQRDAEHTPRTVMCSRESVHPADIRTTHQNVQVVRDGRSKRGARAIVSGTRSVVS